MPTPAAVTSRGRALQRACACGGTRDEECAECKKKDAAVQRKPAADAHRHSDSRVPPIVGEVLRSSGDPLDAGARAVMEKRFRHDFSRVRVHTGGSATQSADAVGASAYTVGNDIVFADGQYAPGTPGGARLLAHELTHVVQQRDAPAVDEGQLEITPVDDAAEREAASFERLVMRGLESGVDGVNATEQRVARADFKVGGAKVHIDYGNVVTTAAADYVTEIERLFAAFTGAPAAQIHADVAALSTSRQEWVLFGIDLLMDNPVAGLDKTEAVKRLIGRAPKSTFKPLGGDPTKFEFANEVLMASGWFEFALATSLAAPKDEDLKTARKLLDPGGSGGSGSSSCPSPRPASQTLDEPKLRTELPKLLETRVKKETPPAGLSSVPIGTVTPIADLVQTEAAAVFAPFASRGRSGSLDLNKWQYSANVVETTAASAAPTLEKRLAFLDNRARLVAGDSLFDTVHFDSRCDADETVLGDIVKNMESQAAISTAVDSILRQLSYTEQASNPKRVVANLQFDPNKKSECVARWHLVNTLSHELLHVMVHDGFRGKAAGRQIMVEGFTEILGDQLYDSIASKARKDKAFQAKFETGVSAAPCSDIPVSSTGYGEAGKNADKLRLTVGNDRFRAAYFLGRIDLLGVAPKREDGAGASVFEREAVEAETRGAEPSAAVSRSVGRHRATIAALPSLRALTVDPLGEGRPLDDSTRVSMESHLGYDFRKVRVHADSRAADSARGVNAQAYAVGSDIVFGAGRYAPASDAGRRLLAHELTHVVQQSGMSAPVRQRMPEKGAKS